MALVPDSAPTSVAFHEIFGLQSTRLVAKHVMYQIHNRRDFFILSSYDEKRSSNSDSNVLTHSLSVVSILFSMIGGQMRTHEPILQYTGLTVGNEATNISVIDIAEKNKCSSAMLQPPDCHLEHSGPQNSRYLDT